MQARHYHLNVADSRAMAFCPYDDEGDAPPLRSEAENTLKMLLDKQLSTSVRLEQVEFDQATESMHHLGHGASGISSLSEFIKNESAQKHLLEKSRLLQNVLHGMGYSKGKVQEKCQNLGFVNSPTSRSSDKGTKRNRYGPDPLFLLYSETEDVQIASLESKQRLTEDITNGLHSTSFCHHSKEVEASLLRGKDRRHTIAHLSGEGSACRKPLFGELEGIGEQLCMTPQERVRHSLGKAASRLSSEVFLRPAQEVLELHDYLNQKSQVDVASCADAALPASRCEQHADTAREQDCHDLVKEIPEKEIVKNRLSQDEIRNLPSGKFVNYSPGTPSHVLYIKNLCREVTEADLAALFVRYQCTQQPLLFRLMKRGRMKGQAFVTFNDVETSSNALLLLNGYKLKGKPMVIHFGHSNASISL